MSRWTYLAGAGLFGSFLGLMAAHSLPWFGWLGVLLGCLAPHLLRGNRHTQPSHSLLAAILTTLLWSELSWGGIRWPLWFAAGWGAGYLGHILLDSMTVQGVSIFWPSSAVAVLPKPERFRIEPGTPAERRLRVGLWVVGFLLVPLQTVGLRGTLHRFVQTPQAAEEDYLRYTHDHHRVWVQFEGFFTDSQRPVSGRWEAIHAPTANTLLLLDPSGRVHRLGNHPTDTVRPSRVRALRGEPVKVQIKEISLKHQPLWLILKEVSRDSQAFLTGWAILEDPVALHYSQEEFPTIEITERRIEFSHAPISELARQRLSEVQVLRGYFLVREVRRVSDVKRWRF